MTTEDRFEKMEQQISRLKMFVAGACALALVATVAGTVGVTRAALPHVHPPNPHIKAASIHTATLSVATQIKMGNFVTITPQQLRANIGGYDFRLAAGGFEVKRGSRYYLKFDQKNGLQVMRGSKNYKKIP